MPRRNSSSFQIPSYKLACSGELYRELGCFPKSEPWNALRIRWKGVTRRLGREGSSEDCLGAKELFQECRCFRKGMVIDPGRLGGNLGSGGLVDCSGRSSGIAFVVGTKWTVSSTEQCIRPGIRPNDSAMVNAQPSSRRSWCFRINLNKSSLRCAALLPSTEKRSSYTSAILVRLWTIENCLGMEVRRRRFVRKSCPNR